MRRLLVSLCCALGCAGSFDPKPIDAVGFRERAQTQTEEGVRVTAAVPSAEESRQLFSRKLYRDGVQPVWLEIENRRDETVSFLPVGLDSNYFSPIEAANLDLEADLSASNPERNRYFFVQGLDPVIEPGRTRSGFVFTGLDEGTKTFNVDLVGEQDNISFTFFVPVPGLKVDHHEVDWENLHAPNEVVDVDERELIEAIARQPCCATDAAGEGTADPLNLVVIGTPEDVYYAFIRAGWDETETIHRASLAKTALSFFTGGEYRYSPVSSLYVFGRKQDVAFQKAR
ncbi:MAG: LssY C-terminal domain-containing protein, partial [Myxococcota bacterium]|nr:LssY C-terminal domain-containing protein [Myxococcota bacterium]